MGPPAKRLRILQSVEVDETNPDYIAAKQKQQQKLKSRFESIIDKYGGMHESMSDEIDFKTGKVVVDRGHLRRVQRHMMREGPTLVDNFLDSAFEQDHESEEDEQQVQSEDELAPTQTQKRKRDSVENRGETAQTSDQQDMALVRSPPQAAPTALAHGNALQTPNRPDPTTYLYQQIQQTPLDQQTQAALFANLNQTIAQAVQQAVMPLLGILQNTPNGQAAQALFPVPSPQLPATDNVRPAADPKWYFPPISAAKETTRSEYQKFSPPIVEEAPPLIEGRVDASSPLVLRRRSPKVHVQRRQSSLKRKRSSQVLEASVERPQSSHSLPALCNNVCPCPGADPLVDTTPDCKAKRNRSNRKYHFTEEDDIDITERRGIHNISFKEIKASKAKWSGWPLSAFYNHWQNHLKDKSLQLRDTPRTDLKARHDTSLPPEHEEQFFSSKEIPETSSAEYRLPTPSSLEQDDTHVERALIPSSSHFDDDELELLSLAGADISDVVPSHTSHHADDTYPTPDEPLPSVEGAEFRNEDELQFEMLKTEESPTPEPTLPKVLPSTIPETQESVVVSSPSQTRKANSKSKAKPVIIYRAASDSSDDLDLIGANDEPTTPRVRIKREPLTPQASKILCSSPIRKTPRPVPQSSDMTIKSTGKLDRRAYLKVVKQGWTRAKGRLSGSQKRRISSNTFSTPWKGAQVEVEVGDSEDELAV